MMNKYLMLICVSIFFIGCTKPLIKKRLANFTIVSTRNVDYSKLQNISKNLKARGVEAIEWTTDDNIEGGIQQVIENAVVKAGGDFMVNCVLYSVTQGEKTGYMVQGDVIETLEDQYSD